MQEISAQAKPSKRGLTIPLWIVLGGVVLYFAACFLPLLWVNDTGIAEPENLWRIVFRPFYKLIDEPWLFMGLLATILIALFLLVQLFRRRVMKAFMAVNLVLSGVVLFSIARIAWIYFAWEIRRAEALRDYGVHLEFGVMALGGGFYLLLIALLVMVAGSIVGLARKRREVTSEA